MDLKIKYLWRVLYEIKVWGSNEPSGSVLFYFPFVSFYSLLTGYSILIHLLAASLLRYLSLCKYSETDIFSLDGSRLAVVAEINTIPLSILYLSVWLPDRKKKNTPLSPYWRKNAIRSWWWTQLIAVRRLHLTSVVRHKLFFPSIPHTTRKHEWQIYCPVRNSALAASLEPVANG